MLEEHDGIEVVGQAEDGMAALESIQSLKPDVALVDVSMPKRDGLDVTAEVRAMGLGTRVLILTMYTDEQYALRTIKVGAAGFVSKSAPFEELIKAITAVHDGQRYLPDEIEEAYSEELAAIDAKKRPVDTLSKREFQVMGYLATGLTNREIAKELGISVKTIDTHRGHVLKKLKLRNNSDITRFAIRHGFVAA
jgi:two-component system response regulator NreC